MTNQPILAPTEMMHVCIDRDGQVLRIAILTIAYDPLLVSKETVLACLHGAGKALADIAVHELETMKEQ